MQLSYTCCMGGADAIIRPVRMTDLDAVLGLVQRGGAGLTNLPPDRSALAKRIEAAECAIEEEDARSAGAPVMLVMELGGAIVGTGLIFARIGVEWPFYSYRITRQAGHSRAVARSKAQRLLNLVNDFDGQSEVGGLFVDPTMRGLALGQLMARSRYMFMATHRTWFGDRVIAELRGYQDGDGRSPVWDAIGRHFYDMEFEEADRTGAIHGNQFIADLGPRYPIYVSMLPERAQAALGRPHDDGRPAHAMLLAEGFHDDGYVDIFDGGPTLVASINAVVTVSTSYDAPYLGACCGGTPALVSVGTSRHFRLVRALVTLTDDGLRIDQAAAALLGASPGDRLRIALDRAADRANQQEETACSATM